jgi:cytochrome c-type protein NapB
MTKTVFTLLVAAALGSAVLTACVSGTGGAPVQSLRGADAATPDQAPDVRQQLGRKPGTQKPVERTFAGQPPLIPHATDNFDEVTLADNQCLECHGEANYRKKDAPRLGDSHYVGADGRTLQTSDGRRYACTLCHAPQFDAPPLVDNTFRGAAQK